MTMRERARELYRSIECGCHHCIRGWDENQITAALESVRAEGSQAGYERGYRVGRQDALEEAATVAEEGGWADVIASNIRSLKGNP